MPRKKTEVKKLPTEVKLSDGGSFLGKIVIILVLLALAASSVWYFLKYQDAKKQISILSSLEGQQEISKEEIEKVLKDVGKLILLPTNETPTVATIEDAQALAKDQAFFAEAQNGDKVLIYSDRAIIYSPERNVLVNVGPIYFQDQATPTEEATGIDEEEVTEAETMSLDIRNGSRTQGVAKSLEDKLSTNDDYSVASVGNASRLDYSETVLVNLGGGDVSALEAELGVTAVSALPDGEEESSADVVIILGNL